MIQQYVGDYFLSILFIYDHIKWSHRLRLKQNILPAGQSSLKHCCTLMTWLVWFFSFVGALPTPPTLHWGGTQPGQMFPSRDNAPSKPGNACESSPGRGSLCCSFPNVFTQRGLALAPARRGGGRCVCCLSLRSVPCSIDALKSPC